MVIGELLVQWKYLLWQNILLANNPRRVLLEKRRLDERVIRFRLCGLLWTDCRYIFTIVV